MADKPLQPVINGAGNTDIGGLVPGQKYLLCLKASNPADSSASLHFNNGVSEGFRAVDDGAMLGGSGITEQQFTAPSNTLRITLAGTFTGGVQVTCVPIIN